jgi:hypothetical protein
MKHLLRLSALLGLTAVAAARAETEDNLWPVRVARKDNAGQTISWQAVGPLFFEKPAAEPGTVSGFRPFFAEWTTPSGAVSETNFLYPIFTYHTDGETYRWSVFNLINRSGDHAGRVAARPTTPTYETFDVWPFWFSKDTGSPADSYRALFPIAGTIKHRFGSDEIKWGLFPLYLRTESKGAVTTSTPWPFIKVTRGTEHGFALWPLYGTREKESAFHRQFFLWPLGWNNTIQPSAEAAPGTPPRREVGFLPFYAKETAPGFVNESVLWPFFGYTDRTQPLRYHETRYFWPLLVQGRGDDRTTERYGPFYTHSVAKGVEKTWVMWPLYREKNWSDAGLAQTQRQLFYFIWRSMEQRSLTNPHAAPAEKSTLWPLYSAWDNGAGRQQFQFPSPLDVFFPDNERIRVSWSPLFSLYRFDQPAPGFTHHEVLWGLLSWRREPEHREFHLGPLLSVESHDAQKRVALGHGLVGLRRAAGGGWRLFWFDFPSQANKLHAASR